MCSPQQLRFRFVVLIIEGAATNSLLKDHEDFLMSDFKLNRKMNDLLSYNAILQDIAM